MLSRIFQCDPYALETFIFGVLVGTYLAFAFWHRCDAKSLDRGRATSSELEIHLNSWDWRATVDEDGHYCFAVTLWCRGLPRDRNAHSTMLCDFILRLAAIPRTPQSARLDTAGQRAQPGGSRL